MACPNSRLMQIQALTMPFRDHPRQTQTSTVNAKQCSRMSYGSVDFYLPLEHP